MVGWTLRFFIAAILAMLLMGSELGEGASVVVKIEIGVLLAICSVSLVLALRRPIKEADSELGRLRIARPGNAVPGPEPVTSACSSRWRRCGPCPCCPRP